MYAYTAYRIPVLFTFIAPFTETPLNSEKCMGDIMRNKAIFEMKIAKNAQKPRKFDILKN